MGPIFDIFVNGSKWIYNITHFAGGVSIIGRSAAGAVASGGSTVAASLVDDVVKTGADDLIKVRHHTSKSGLKGIIKDSAIKTSRGKPYGVDVR